MKELNNNIIKAALYFILSVLLTGIFINQKFWLYSSVNAMLLSSSIAASKWMIQIVVALLFLKEKKWAFIRRISFVCFIGSAILFVYYILDFSPLPIGGFSQFILSIGLSVLVMIFLYYKAVKKTRLSLKWFWSWMLCLFIAVFLQTTVVF